MSTEEQSQVFGQQEEPEVGLQRLEPTYSTEHGHQFTPVHKLSDVVETETGEEREETLFKM